MMQKAAAYRTPRVTREQALERAIAAAMLMGTDLATMTLVLNADPAEIVGTIARIQARREWSMPAPERAAKLEKYGL